MNESCSYIKICSSETNEEAWKDAIEVINHAYEEGSESIQERNTCEIYSYAITGSEEVKSIQLIASWVSEKFTDIMIDINVEQLLISMSESRTMRI